MPFKYDFSDELKKTLKKLYAKDRQRYEMIMNKAEEVASRNPETIDFYKNLRHDLKDFKRVHIDKSLCLFSGFTGKRTSYFSKGSSTMTRFTEPGAETASQ